MNWFRDYVWKTQGEVIRLAFIVGAGAGLEAFGSIQNVSELNGALAASVGVAVLNAVISFIRGRLPQPS